jgi:hypothetical protein
MKDGDVIQVAYVVKDLDAAMRRHWEVCGIGPWHIYEFHAPKVQNYTYRGKPATHSCLIAVTFGDRTQVELMQPVSGYSIYDEFLEAKGEGLHHVKLFYSDCAKAVAEYERRGYPVIQSGLFDETSTTTSIPKRTLATLSSLATAGASEVPSASIRRGAHRRAAGWRCRWRGRAPTTLRSSG